MYHKKVFSSEIISRISQTIREEPSLTRCQLAFRVCEWMNWRNPAGKLQAMSCRKMLLTLHRRKVITLPEPKKLYAFQKPRAPVSTPPIAVIEGLLEELGAVDLIRVTSSELSRVWRGMMEAHHYLKSGPICGAQLRYLARSTKYGWLGGLSYSACARRVECRDAWIGWTEPARLENHIRLVNNSRFLIAPTVKVKGLASHVLAQGQARLAADWETTYGYKPLLLETYVERGRFEGTCYRAANWQHIGNTIGRGRKGVGVPVKDVFLFPLTPDWQTQLCNCADGTQQLRKVVEPAPPRDWIEAELRGAHFGDTRLTARLLQMTGMFYAKSTASIPEACGSMMAAKAAYRFLDNENVTLQSILQPHYEATEERLREHRLVLVAQDTTTLNYTTHHKTEGLGPISDKGQVHGLIVHDTLSFTPQGTPLGLLNVQWWAREGISGKKNHAAKPIEEKESMKWIESYRAVSAIQNRCRQTKLVVLTDREGDIHELFDEQRKTSHGADILVRAERTRKRKVAGGEAENPHELLLWTRMEAQPVIGTRELLVPPSEDRPARIALLEVRSLAVCLQPPKSKPHLAEVPAWAVLARELNPPENVEGLEWMLLTSVAINQPEDAFIRLEWYTRRWGIEVFHRVLKSGCCIEARQLGHAQRLMNCMAIDMIVAWRIYYLTSQGEETADVPCSVYFSDSEWKALTTFVNRIKTPPSTPPSLNEAVRLLGNLGGHLGRTGDGHPGCEVLWRGMARLADVEVAYDLYR